MIRGNPAAMEGWEIFWAECWVVGNLGRAAMIRASPVPCRGVAGAVPPEDC